MTPKEKAAELLSMFEQETMPFHEVLNIKIALICVDQIIKASPTELVDGSMFTMHPVAGMVKIDTTSYWQQVKEELQKMYLWA